MGDLFEVYSPNPFNLENERILLTKLNGITHEMNRAQLELIVECSQGKKNRKECQKNTENHELFGAHWLLMEMYCMWKRRRQEHNKVTASQGSFLAQASLILMASLKLLAWMYLKPIKPRNKNGDAVLHICKLEIIHQGFESYGLPLM